MSRLSIGYEAHLESQRVSRARGTRRCVAVHCIEGEYVTKAQIGMRLGLSAKTIEERLKLAKRRPEPVTWDSLQRGKA